MTIRHRAARIVECADKGTDAFKYKSSDSLTVSKEIVNVVPSDFNLDGHLDLLVMYDEGGGGWWAPKSERKALEVHLGDGKGGFGEKSHAPFLLALLYPEILHTLPAVIGMCLPRVEYR